MHVLNFIFVMLEVLVLFNLLIFVHELGHFLAARWRGLKIERFAIWFGKPIWKKNIGGIEYAIGSIPAGGYVQLPQMAPMEMLEGKSETSEPLPPISALDKIIVAFAGPLFSLLLAFTFAVVVYVVGKPTNDNDTTVVGYVVKGGPAYKAGLRAGDDIQSVDGHPVTKFSGFGSSITWRIVRSESSSIEITAKRDGVLKTFEVSPSLEETKWWQRKNLRKIQIAPSQVPRISAFYTNSPAEAAGLKIGDEILDVDGQKIYGLISLQEYVEDHGTNQMQFKVRRGAMPIVLSVTPEIPLGSPTNKPSIGISDFDNVRALSHPDPVSQIVSSAGAMYSTFDALFSSKSDIKAQHLSGPVKILSIYYMLFQSEDGWRLAIWFSVLFNVNLAILNMLPFPVLDGGHILLALIEVIRHKPVSARILNHLQTACAMLLIGYMLYITFFDVQDLFPGGKGPAEIRFTPKNVHLK